MDDLEQLARRSIDDFGNTDWVQMVRELVSPDIVYEEIGTGRRIEGIEAVIDAFRSWKAALPDVHAEILRVVSVDDTTVLEVIWSGTHWPAQHRQRRPTRHRGVAARVGDGVAEVGARQDRPRTPSPRHADHARAARRAARRSGGAMTAPVLAPFHRLASDALAAGDLDAFEDLFAQDFVDHSTGETGAAALRTSVAALLAAFSGIRFTITHSVADGNLLAGRGHITGTHTGPFATVPPTGVVIDVEAIDVVRLDTDGRVAERWGGIDRFALLTQLGAIPAR